MSKGPPIEERPLRRLYRYGLIYRGRLFTGLLFGIIGGGSVFGLLKNLGDVTDTAFDFATGSLHSLLMTSLGLVLFFTLRGIGHYFSIYFINWVGFKVVEDLRRECFGKLQQLQLSFYSRHSSGELISRVTNDTTQVQHAVSGVVADIAQQPFALAAALGYMLYTDWMLAGLSLIVFPVCVAPVIIFGRKVRKYSRQSQEHLSDLSSVLQENVSGVRVVKAFGMEAYEETKFNRENRKVFGRLIKIVLARNVNQPLMEIVSALGVVSVLVYVYLHQMSYGDFISFAAALALMYHPAKMLGKVHMEIQKAMGAAERIFSLLDEPIDVVESPEAHMFDEPVREIRLDHVSFAYDDGPVLQDISLTIPAGQTVALVGASGSGKSSLVSLIPRFYDPTQGNVFLNQHNLRDLRFDSLRRHIALVTQDTFLFNDTIAANIAYGQADADMETVITAAKRANAHDFILEMSDGYQTRVGERGGRLSGGQRQRLAIARAIYRDAPILILDEATSALDNESERLVQEAINEMMRGRTSLVIAHRLSTIQNADRILVMQEGRIVEQGTHQELLERGGIYRRLSDLALQP